MNHTQTLSAALYEQAEEVCVFCLNGGCSASLIDAPAGGRVSCEKPDILSGMKKLEKFPWSIDEGAVVDFADGKLIFAVKDDSWNDEQIRRVGEPFSVLVCESNGIVAFLLEGGPLDTCDFYFNIQDCDEKKQLMDTENLDVQVVFIDGQDIIQAMKTGTLSREKTKEIQAILKKQEQFEFMPGEYEVNVEGLQSAYEPSELAKYQKTSFELR